MPTYLLNGVSSEELRQQLTQAAKRNLSAKERLEQKVSFIYGSINEDGLTKEKIRSALRTQEA